MINNDFRNLEGYDSAARVVQKYLTPRFHRLHRLENFVFGRQYDDRPVHWLDNSSKTPLWERKPVIVYSVARSAIQSNVDLVLGEGRFPEITARPAEESDGETEGELGEDDSDSLDRFIRDLMRIAKLKAHFRGAFFSAQMVGTAVGIFGFRNGRPFADEVHAKWSTPTFDVDGNVTSLEIKYPYLIEEKGRNGKRVVKAKLFRRVIDAQRDTTFLPGDAREDGVEPDWIPDPARTIEHGLGFCPVVWHAHVKGCSIVSEIDGRAIHAELLDELQALDYVLSQEHRAALWSEPQLVEIGVAPGYNPTGETARLPILVHASEQGGPMDPLNPPRSGFVDTDAAATEGRLRGPGYPYQYPGNAAEIRVEYLTYPPEALQALSENAEDLRQKILENLSVVFLDAATSKIFAGELSGKALMAVKQRQLDRCDQYRDDFGDGYIIPALLMLCRMVVRVSEKSSVKLPNVRKIVGILAKVQNDPTLTPRWGAYFKPDAEEQKAIVETVVAARGGTGGEPVITRRMAIEKIAEVFPIEAIDAIVEELEGEAETRAEDELDRTIQETKALHAAKGSANKPGN